MRRWLRSPMRMSNSMRAWFDHVVEAEVVFAASSSGDRRGAVAPGDEIDARISRW